MAKNSPEISVIVPIYNEGKEVTEFLNELIVELKKLKKSYEILIFDDGKNNSREALVKYVKKNKGVKVYEMVHPGVTVTDKTYKYMLGFEKAQGKYIFTMDGDRQDRPEEMHKFIKKIDEGYEFVIGRKQKRKDGLIYVLTSRVANGLMRMFTGVTTHDMNNGFKCMTQRVAKSLNLKAGHFRFMPVIAQIRKWKYTEVPVKHIQRTHGQGKFTFKSRLQGGLFDLFVVMIIYKMGDTPMYLLGWTSLWIAMFALISALIYLFVYSHIAILLLTFGLFQMAILLYGSGVLMEYTRINSPKKNYSEYIIEEF